MIYQKLKRRFRLYKKLCSFFIIKKKVLTNHYDINIMLITGEKNC